jgi:hypothetical protein
MAAMTRRASSPSAIREVLSGDRDDLRRRDQPGDRSWREMNPGSSAIGNDARQVVEVVLARPGLWTRIIACGVAPWMRPRVTLL